MLKNVNVAQIKKFKKQSPFLDTQVSLAPTHVSPSVRPLVGPSHFRISNLWSPFCATVVFDDHTAMLLVSPPSPSFFKISMTFQNIYEGLNARKCI